MPNIQSQDSTTIKQPADLSHDVKDVKSAIVSHASGYDDEEVESEEHQLLEQENAMMYNELQSTHEEVKQITRQVSLATLQMVEFVVVATGSNNFCQMM